VFSQELTGRLVGLFDEDAGSNSVQDNF